MLVSDIARRVRTFVGDDVSQALVNDASIIDGVNDAQLEFNMMTNVITNATTVNTVANTNAYVLPPEVISINRVIDLSNSQGTLQPISRNQAVEISESMVIANPGLVSGSGIPAYYSAEHNKLYLFPVPDNVYSYHVSYVQVPISVAALTDPLTLPLYMQPLVARWIFAQVKERDEDFEAAAMIKMEVRTKLGELTALAKSAQEESYPYIVDTEGGTSSYPVGAW